MAFSDPTWVNYCLDVLREVSCTHDVAILAYCFMPDHLHPLVHNKGNSSIIRFVKDLKKFTGYHYKKQTGRQLWHKSYHDHFVRSEEVSSPSHGTFSPIPYEPAWSLSRPTTRLPVRSNGGVPR